MPHPMHELLHKQFGIDSFALDGDRTRLQDTWLDRPRK